MTFSANDFADRFGTDWLLDSIADEVPAGHLDGLPPSFRSLWQDWSWSWEVDRSQPVFHEALRAKRPRNCNVYTQGNPEGIDHLYISGQVRSESADGVWAFEGSQVLVAWAVPTEENPVFVASGIGNLPHEEPPNGKFTKVHEGFAEDIAEEGLNAYGVKADATHTEVYLNGRLTGTNVVVEADDPGGPLHGAFLTGAGFRLVPNER
jgi:hypothetical protein